MIHDAQDIDIGQADRKLTHASSVSFHEGEEPQTCWMVTVISYTLEVCRG